MFLRVWFKSTIELSALLLLLPSANAQQEPITAQQIVSKYMEAIGADRFPTITTFVESGELSGNLTNFWQGYRSAVQSRNQEHGTFESYFKSPNLRFRSSLTEKNQIIAMYGCDGKVAWYIDSSLKRTESKPKDNRANECKEGFSAAQSGLREPNAKIRLLKKKNVEGRMAWEVKVDVPKSPVTELYYFDVETFLLLRLVRGATSITYSDYRDLSGIKLPFTTVEEFTNSKLVTTIREVKINAAIDGMTFTEPEVRGGRIFVNPSLTAKKEGSEVANTAPATPLAPGNSDLSLSESAGTNTSAGIVEVNFPNFTSCGIEELQLIVPELKGLKPSADRGELAGLLAKVGAKTVDVARNTPNLISRESVTESEQGNGETRRDYDYLILAHVEEKTVGLDEFRLDLKSGDKFQTDEVMKKEFWDELERASKEVAS